MIENSFSEIGSKIIYGAVVFDKYIDRYFRFLPLTLVVAADHLHSCLLRRALPISFVKSVAVMMIRMIRMIRFSTHDTAVKTGPYHVSTSSIVLEPVFCRLNLLRLADRNDG